MHQSDLRPVLRSKLKELVLTPLAVVVRLEYIDGRFLLDASFDAAESPERRFKCGGELLEKLSTDSEYD